MHLIALIACLLISGLIQGGFYGICYLFIGILTLIIFPFIVKKLPPKKILFAGAAFCALYILSTVVNGYSFDSAVSFSRPIVCFVFLFIIYNTDKAKLLKVILFSVCAIAFVSVVLYAAKVPGMASAGRLQGTFQYSNAAGICFAAAALMSNGVSDKKLKSTVFLFETALILTQSVGAVLCYILGYIFMFILSKISRQKFNAASQIITLGISLACAAVIYMLTRYFFVGAIVITAMLYLFRIKLYDAVGKIHIGKIILYLGGIVIVIIATVAVVMRSNALYTYAERLIQFSDSVNVIFHNSLSGIGAGNWQNVFAQWQSYPYGSAFMHSSIGQIGIDAGVLAVIVAGYMAYLFFRKKEASYIFIAGLMIAAHSLLDITLNFVFIDFLLIAAYYLVDKDEPYVIKYKSLSFSAYIPMCFLIYLFLGQLMINSAKTENEFERTEQYVYSSYTNSYSLLNWCYDNQKYDKAANLSMPCETYASLQIKTAALVALEEYDAAFTMAVKAIEAAPQKDIQYTLARKIIPNLPEWRQSECEKLLNQYKEATQVKQTILNQFMKGAD